MALQLTKPAHEAGVISGNNCRARGEQLTDALLQKQAEQWWWSVSDEMSMADHLRADAYVNEFTKGFRFAFDNQ